MSSVHSMADREPNCLTMNTRTGVYSVAFSPDGKTVAAGMEGVVSLWCPNTGHKVAGMNSVCTTTHSLFTSVAFSQHGDGVRTEAKLAAGCFDSNVYLWNSSICKAKERSESDGKLTGLRGWVNSITFTVDGSHLVSGSYDCSVRLWDVSKKQELMRFNGHIRFVASVASITNKIVSGSGDSTVRIWDMSTGTELLQMNDYNNRVWSVACSPEGGPSEKIVASGGYDKSIHLWDMLTGQQIAKLDGHTNSVKFVAFSPDGKTLVSASDDGTVRLWDISTRRPLHILKGVRHSGWVDSVEFSSDSKRLASGHSDGFVRIWTL